MGLVLQETSVQVKYWNHANLTKKQVKKSCSLKLDRYLDRNSIHWDLRTKLDRSWIYRDLQYQNFQIWFLALVDMYV